MNTTYAIELPAARLTSTEEVTQACAAVPLIAPYARLVGNWVWIEFPAKPHVEVLTWIKQTGFRWNGERQAWQHSCGHFTRRNRRIDPRQVYGQLPLDAPYCTRDEAGPAPRPTSPPPPRERFRDELASFQAI